MRDRWLLWSDTRGVRERPEPVDRLPAGAEKSGDGKWATLYDREGHPVQVFMVERRSKR